MVVSALPTNWNPNHAPTATELKQVLDAIRLAQDPPGCIVRRVAAQSISNNTFTDISFDTEVADNDNMFAATSTTVTIQHDGYILNLAGMKWGASGTGLRAQAISINGTVVDDMAFELGADAGSNNRYGCGGGVPLVTSDTVKLNGFQASGGALNAQARLLVVRLFGPGS